MSPGPLAGVNFDDPEERARVYSKIAPLIMEFKACCSFGVFKAEELRRFVLEREPQTAPDSPGRILRALRLEGRLNYVVINRRASLYQFCVVSKRRQPREPQPDLFSLSRGG